jgi:hypothetical protein
MSQYYMNYVILRAIWWTAADYQLSEDHSTLVLTFLPVQADSSNLLQILEGRKKKSLMCVLETDLLRFSFKIGHPFERDAPRMQTS